MFKIPAFCLFCIYLMLPCWHIGHSHPTMRVTHRCPQCKEWVGCWATILVSKQTRGIDLVLCNKSFEEESEETDDKPMNRGGIIIHTCSAL